MGFIVHGLVSLMLVFESFVLIQTIQMLLVSQSMGCKIQNKISTIINNTIHSDVHYYLEALRH